MVCTVCLGFSSHYFLSEKKKKRRCEKTINFRGSDAKKSPIPSMGKTNLLEHTHHPCGLGKHQFFSQKIPRDPAIVGPPATYILLPYHSYFRIPWFVWGIVWEGYQKGVPLLGVPGIALEKSPNQYLNRAQHPLPTPN